MYGDQQIGGHGNEDYKPSGATLELLENFSIQNEDRADNILVMAKKEAQTAYLMQLPASELVRQRIVCHDWKVEANKIIDKKVKHLMLFEDRFNVREYEVYLSKTNSLQDGMSVEDLMQSHTHAVLLCNDIKTIARSEEFARVFSNVEKLTFFGGSKQAPEWHQELNELLQNFTISHKLKSLVVHRYGYYSCQSFIEYDFYVYSQLEEVHFVQPSARMVKHLRDSNVFSDFVHVGGHTPVQNSVLCKKITLDTHTPAGKTKIYIHQIVPYGEHNVSTSLEEILEEESYF